MHRVQEQGDEQGIGGQDEYIDDDHAHGHDDVEVREQPGRCPGAFHQRLVGEEEEKADEAPARNTVMMPESNQPRRSPWSSPA